MPSSISTWLANLDEPLDGSKASLERSIEEDSERVVSKRQKLSKNGNYLSRKRACSESQLNHIISPPSSTVDPRLSRRSKSVDENRMSTGNRMIPPPSPSDTAVSRSASISRSESGAGGLTNPTPSTVTRDRIKLPTYRDSVLNRHGVQFREPWKDLPASIALHYNTYILQKELAGVGLSIEEAEMYRRRLWTYEMTGSFEDTFSEIMVEARIFPPGRIDNNLARNPKGPLNRNSLPRTVAKGIDPIVGPVPDFAYGYMHRTFSVSQLSVANSRSCFQPSAGLYWPFLIIELKSQPRGNNTWYAENQCAGGGTVCANGGGTLSAHFQETFQEVSDNLDADSIAYSLAVDTKTAQLFVHWRVSSSEYYLQAVQEYSLGRPADLISLQTSLRNIVDWGMGPRLEWIKRMIDQMCAAGDPAPGEK